MEERRTLTAEPEIRAKYMDCATRVLNNRDARRLDEIVTHLEALENVSALMQIISGKNVKATP